MKISQIVEATPNISGLPRELIRKVWKTYGISHDVVPVKIDKLPAWRDMLGTGFISKVSDNDIRVLIPGRFAEYNIISWKDGKIRERVLSTMKEVKMAFKVSDELYKIEIDSAWSPERIYRNKSNPYDQSEEILDYMNKTYLPRIKQKYEPLFNNHEDAEMVIRILNRGFTHSNIVNFLDDNNIRYTKSGHYENTRLDYESMETFVELINSPNGKASFAKSFVSFLNMILKLDP